MFDGFAPFVSKTVLLVKSTSNGVGSASSTFDGSRTPSTLSPLSDSRNPLNSKHYFTLGGSTG